MARIRFAHPDAIRTCRVRDERGVVIDQDWMPVGVSPPCREGIFRLGPEDYIVADSGLDPRSVFTSSEPSAWLRSKGIGPVESLGPGAENTPPRGSEVGYIHTRRFIGWLRSGTAPDGCRLSSYLGQWYLDHPADGRVHLVITDYADPTLPAPVRVPPPRYLEVREAKRRDPTIKMARLR